MSQDSSKLAATIPTLGITHTFMLEKGRRYLLGSAEMEPDMLVFSPDRSLSRRQVWLEIVDDVLIVERHPKASQSLNGDAGVKTLQLKSGETFAAGLSIFRFIGAHDAAGQSTPDLTYTLSARDFSSQLREHNTRNFLEVVSAMPALMQKNETPADFLCALCETLQARVPGLEVTAWRVQWRGELPESLLLQPGEYEATICLFDLRGSSRVAEEVSLIGQAAIAQHFAHLEGILGEATDVIFATGGIVIDFQGDAILACWGVPPTAAPQNPILQASNAARRIVDLMMEHDWPVGESNLRCGIGITSGKVLAGLFTARGPDRTLLAKYTVIGPPVNHAARLESMTKKFGVPILIDGAVAAALTGQNVPLRRIAAVRPAGMNWIIHIHEMVMPKAAGGTGVTAEGIEAYETALAFFEKGNFDAAAEAMRKVPHDQIELFLSEQITAMRRQSAPKDWEGVINLSSK